MVSVLVVSNRGDFFVRSVFTCVAMATAGVDDLCGHCRLLLVHLNSRVCVCVCMCGIVLPLCIYMYYVSHNFFLRYFSTLLDICQLFFLNFSLCVHCAVS